MINISKPTGNQQRETKTHHVIEGFNPRAWLKVKIEERFKSGALEKLRNLQSDCKDWSSIQISYIWPTGRGGSGSDDNIRLDLS